MNSIVGNYGLSGISSYSQSTLQEYTTHKNTSKQQQPPVIHEKNENIHTTLNMSSNSAAKDLDMIRPTVWQTYSPTESNQYREAIFQKLEGAVNKMQSSSTDEKSYSATKALYDHLKIETQYATEFWLASKVLIAESS